MRKLRDHLYMHSMVCTADSDPMPYGLPMQGCELCTACVCSQNTAELIHTDKNAAHDIVNEQAPHIETDSIKLQIHVHAVELQR